MVRSATTFKIIVSTMKAQGEKVKLSKAKGVKIKYKVIKLGRRVKISGMHQNPSMRTYICKELTQLKSIACLALASAFMSLKLTGYYQG